ncbi:putative reverse transcriptase domain-containing protein [Tanacetum coccineum]
MQLPSLCAPRCNKCKKVGHLARDCRGAAVNTNTQRGLKLWARQGQNSNVVTGMFLLNNRYALILFDTGTDRSFVSTAFSYLIDIVPTTLDHGYGVELADGKIIKLTKYHAVIVCDEKLVRVPFGNEVLIFRGDGSNNGYESRLNIISCTKTQKYLLKGCQVFLAHITTKKAKDKSEEKRLKDVPIV